METLKNIVYAACLSLAFVSCSDKDNYLDQSEAKVKAFTTFTATVDETAGTRAHIIDPTNSGIKHIRWDDGDRMLVFSDEQLDFKYFTLESASDGKGVFSGNEVKGNKFYALYPPNGNGWEVDSETPTILHYYLSNTDKSSTDNDFKFMFPMVAFSEDQNLVFKQTTGIIRITVGGGINITRVMLNGNNYEKIYGSGYVDLSEDTPIFRLYDDENGYWFTSGWLDENLNLEEETADLVSVVAPAFVVTFLNPTIFILLLIGCSSLLLEPKKELVLLGVSFVGVSLLDVLPEQRQGLVIHI